MLRKLSKVLFSTLALAAMALTAAMSPVQEAPATRPAQTEAIGTTTVDVPAVSQVAESRNLSKAPETVAELLDLESRIREVVQKVLPATVSLVITRENNTFQGSGVIISPDGYVMTAAHVAERPGNRVTVIMPDGTRYRGITLGMNRGLDDGLVKIEDESATELPFAPIGSADDLPLGTWTVALGHPGGYQRDRPPVVRVGRILTKAREYILTDNTLVGGDSGGPLFDLDGRVIGIHSRIEQGINNNVHVPSDRFLEDWQEMAASRQWGGMVPDWMRRGPAADDGLRFDLREDGQPGARVTRILARSPGEAAGIQLHDRVTAIDGKPVNNAQDVMLRRAGLSPGEAATYTILRGGRTLELELTPVRPDRMPRQPPEARNPARPVMGIEMDDEFMGPGVRLNGVPEGGPAHQAGLQAGDVIISYDSQLLRNASELGELMARSEVGQVKTLKVRRGERELSIDVTLRAWRDVYGESR